MRPITLVPTLFLVLPAVASAGKFLMSTEIETSTGWGINPCVVVGFDTSAGPAGTLTASLSDAEAPAVELADLSISGASFVWGFGADSDDVSVSSISLAADDCGAREDVTLYPLADGDEVALAGTCATGDLPLTITLSDGSTVRADVSISGGTHDPVSIVGFNPQPEPPGLPTFALKATFDRGRTVDLSVVTSVIDPTTGDAATFH